MFTWGVVVARGGPGQGHGCELEQEVGVAHGDGFPEVGGSVEGHVAVKGSYLTRAADGEGVVGGVEREGQGGLDLEEANLLVAVDDPVGPHGVGTGDCQGGLLLAPEGGDFGDEVVEAGLQGLRHVFII